MDRPPRLRIFRPAESDEVAKELASSAHAVTQGPPAGSAAAETQLSGPEAGTEMTRENHSALSLLRRLVPFTGSLLVLALLSGCTALRPLKGIPVRKLPWDARGESRANMETIDLSRLGQTPAPVYLIDSGDVLAIYVEGVLGRIEDVPPVYIPQNGDSNPSLGYPIPVREDGTISLPLIPPVMVRGKSIAQVEDMVRRAYTVDREILERGRERIMVAMQKPRTYKITVLRQESSNAQLVAQSSGSIQLGQTKKGTGQIVVLQAGENDVLHALTLSGGLPGLDAQNAIYVLRRPRPGEYSTAIPFNAMTPSKKSGLKGIQPTIQLTSGQGAYSGRYDLAAAPATGSGAPKWGHSAPQADPARPVDLEGFGQTGRAAAAAYRQEGVEPRAIDRRSPPLPPPPVENLNGPPLIPGVEDDGQPIYPPELQPYLCSGAQVIRIPIRLKPGEEANFSEPDIMLFDGDILFIESRETEIFYTGGLLGGGQFMLPRDYDLDVLDAISIAQSQQNGSGGAGFGSRIGGISAINQDISVSASDLVVIRRFPDGQRMNIKINLNRALRDPSENLIIQPGDRLVLRYRPMEAVGAFIERNILAGSLIGLAAQQGMNKE